MIPENFFVLFDVMSGYTRNATLVVDRMNIVTDVTCVVVLGFKGLGVRDAVRCTTFVDHVVPKLCVMNTRDFFQITCVKLECSG